MDPPPAAKNASAVALLAEGVDRNPAEPALRIPPYKSPSSRRAWIEMTAKVRSMFVLPVALLTEGVDRNGIPTGIANIKVSRPPHGGRG